VTAYSVRGLRNLHDEIILHLPVRAGMHTAWMMRRLADHSFVVIHPQACDICATTLISEAMEWAGVELGRPEMVAVLPHQGADGCLIRSQIRLADDSLAGLVGDQPLVCTRDWEQMVRSSGG
jgi:hypothetical protein